MPEGHHVISRPAISWRADFNFVAAPLAFSSVQAIILNDKSMIDPFHDFGQGS
jgi:hypothetical protein